VLRPTGAVDLECQHEVWFLFEHLKVAEDARALAVSLPVGGVSPDREAERLGLEGRDRVRSASSTVQDPYLFVLAG